MVIIKALIFTLFGPGSALILVPFLLFSSTGNRLSFEIAGLKLIGIIPIVGGLAIYLPCVFNFAILGRGTPAPFDPPKKFVSQGYYQIVRNPMYIGVLLVLLGETILWQSLAILLYGLLLGLSFHLFVIIYEEPNLRKKFGKEYERYLKTVPRWIPRLSPVK